MSEIESLGVPARLVQQLSLLASTASKPERVFMEQIALRQREPNASETTVDEVEKSGVERTQAIAFLKGLESLGCGRFIEGRHGKKSRLTWGTYGAIAIAKAFITPPDQVPTDATTADASDDTTFTHTAEMAASVRMHRHAFLLRPDFGVAFDLPLDLTKEEANRLAEFIRAIPF